MRSDVVISITQRCHSRNPALDAGASGILLKTKKDSGQAGMTIKKIAQLRSEKKGYETLKQVQDDT